MVGAIWTHIFSLGRCTEGVLHLESSGVQQVGHYDVHVDVEWGGAYGCITVCAFIIMCTLKSNVLVRMHAVAFCQLGVTWTHI